MKKDRVLARLTQPSKPPPGQEDQIQKDSKILAPFDGFVLGRMANSGEIVSAGKPVLRFGDLSQMLIELGLPETAVSKMKVGQEVPVKITGLEDAPFTGHVTEVGLAAKEGSRLFKVVIKVPNPQRRIRSGMTASVSLGEKGPATPDAAVVPLSALITSTKPQTKDRLAVFVVSDEGNVQERVVDTGDIVDSSIVITNGLKAGEHIVTVGAGSLYDGAQVTARPAPTP